MSVKAFTNPNSHVTYVLASNLRCKNNVASRVLGVKMGNLENKHKGALAWYGKLTWESAYAWILKILCYLIVWGITLIFMVRLSFYAIPLLIYDVMNDITIIPQGTQL